MAERLPVVVVEEPLLAPEDRDDVQRFGALTVVRPLRTAFRDPFGVDDMTVATVKAMAGPSAIQWLYTPMMLRLADEFAGPLVYDCMDDLAAFAFAPPVLAGRERLLLERADLVFAGGRSLYAARAGYGTKVKLYPSGVDYDMFASTPATEPHRVVAELRRLGPPVYGYTGVIDERIDLELLDALTADPDGPNVIMIGPFAKIAPGLLPRRPTLHFTGQVPYQSLPSFLAGLDVAIMPFALNESTRSISPTKTLEYLAARLPVVSTAIPDVVADFEGIVAIADGAAEFALACTRAPALDGALRDRGAELARSRTWPMLASAMWADIARLALRGSATSPP